MHSTILEAERICGFVMYDILQIYLRFSFSSHSSRTRRSTLVDNRFQRSKSWMPNTFTRLSIAMSGHWKGRAALRLIAWRYSLSGPNSPAPLLQIAEKARIHVTARQVGQFAR